MPTGSLMPRFNVSHSAACPFSIHFTWLMLYIGISFYRTSTYIVFATNRKNYLETALRIYCGVTCYQPDGTLAEKLYGMRLKSQHFVDFVTRLEAIHFPTAHTEQIAEGVTLEDAVIEARLFGIRHEAEMTF